MSVGTGDPPPRQLRDGMGAKSEHFCVFLLACTVIECGFTHMFLGGLSTGFKELVWEVLEHHTSSRDTDVFLSQMLPKNRYVRFAAAMATRFLPTPCLCVAILNLCLSSQLFKMSEAYLVAVASTVPLQCTRYW
eukprot:COSAG02_NODE_3166_length_7245_cov_4.559054_5_plen_134_part_00